MARNGVSLECEAEIMSNIALSGQGLTPDDLVEPVQRVRQSVGVAFTCLEARGFISRHPRSNSQRGHPALEAQPTDYFWLTAAELYDALRDNLDKDHASIHRQAVMGRAVMSALEAGSVEFMRAKVAYLGGTAVLGGDIDLSEMADWYPEGPGWRLLVDLESVYNLSSYLN